jgi:hypothetical protein
MEVNKNKYEEFKKIVLEIDINQFNLKELIAQGRTQELQVLGEALVGLTNSYIGAVQLEINRSRFAPQKEKVDNEEKKK